ncbi:MAG: hypothetical protein IKK63_04040 [Clostridia bacterium]|nr:hypothetical protein [Clostridia bacterium]
MDFDKLKESGRKIKMPDDMKMRIKENCTDCKTPETVSKPPRLFYGRIIAVCVCCFLLLAGIGLKHSGVFNRKIPIESSPSVSATKSATFATTEESTLKQIIETTVKVFYSDKSTKPAVKEEKTTTESQTQVQETECFTEDGNVNSVQPPFLYMDDLNKLKNAKKAAETMDEEYYLTYLSENDYHDVCDCFYFPEEYLEFCSSEIYVPVVDENHSEILWMDYVPSYGSINVGVNFNETDSFRFYIEMSGEYTFRDKDNEKYGYVETVKGENFTADIYKKKLWYKLTEEKWAWDGWLSLEVLVDGQGINILTTDDVTLEELREYLTYVKFVKIKDWI